MDVSEHRGSTLNLCYTYIIPSRSNKPPCPTFYNPRIWGLKPFSLKKLGVSQFVNGDHSRTQHVRRGRVLKSFSCSYKISNIYHVFWAVVFCKKKCQNFARQMDTDLFSPHILCSSGHHTAFGFSASPSPCYDLKQNFALHTVFCPPVRIARFRSS